MTSALLKNQARALQALTKVNDQSLNDFLGDLKEENFQLIDGNKRFQNLF